MYLDTKKYKDVWVTSDPHFFHERIISLSNRPFDGVEDMNETILNNYVSAVEEGDCLIMCGDITWDTQKIFDMLARIPCHIYIIKGNHDEGIFKDTAIKAHNAYRDNKITLVDGLLEADYLGHPITFSHFPMLTFNKSHFGAYNIHGHHHGNFLIQQKFPGKRLDVGVEAFNYKPVHLSKCIEILVDLPDNWDKIKR